MDTSNGASEQSQNLEPGQQIKPHLLKSILWNIRIDAVIIVAIVVISNVTNWLEQDTVNLIVMLMALFILSQSFQPAFQKHPRLRMGIIIGLTVLLILGVVVFFLSN